MNARRPVHHAAAPRNQRDYAAFVRTLQKLAAWVGGLIVLVFLLLFLEGSGGHDGYLCEWGYDMDGTGTGDTGCE